MDYSKITNSKRVIDLLRERSVIEEKIKRLDPKALLIHDLEALNLTTEKLVSSALKEGRTKSCTKPYTGEGRKATPPPPPSRVIREGDCPVLPKSKQK